jgi:hypothetical protein
VLKSEIGAVFPLSTESLGMRVEEEWQGYWVQKIKVKFDFSTAGLGDI